MSPIFDFLRRRSTDPDPAEADEFVAPLGGAARGEHAVPDPVEPIIASKLLHAWLQNRHQTLVPLTFNFKSLDDERRAILAEAFAALIEAGRPLVEVAAAATALRRWFERLGADAVCLARFDVAMEHPPSLGRILDRAQSHDLSVYAYVLALAAVDPIFPASGMLPDFVQARLDIATAAARTAQRRYQR